MSKKLTREYITLKTKTINIKTIKQINLWGSELDDVSIFIMMPKLEIISLSVNQIRTLKDFANMQCLKELYLRNNFISDIDEVKHLTTCPNLKILWLSENPIAKSRNYRANILKTLPNLTKLDDIIVSEKEKLIYNDEEEEERALVKEEEDDKFEDNNYITIEDKWNYSKNIKYTYEDEDKSDYNNKEYSHRIRNNRDDDDNYYYPKKNEYQFKKKELDSSEGKDNNLQKNTFHNINCHHHYLKNEDNDYNDSRKGVMLDKSHKNKHNQQYFRQPQENSYDRYNNNRENNKYYLNNGKSYSKQKLRHSKIINSILILCQELNAKDISNLNKEITKQIISYDT